MDSPSLIGKQIGNYVVKSQLGEGGMGAVYLAEHPEIGRRVALKVILANLARDQEMVDRFVAEARAVARIEHPNIVDVYDFGRTADGELYCTMEVLRGASLESFLAQRGKMTAEQIQPYLEQICGALHAAHLAGVIHRDLKPENIHVLGDRPLRIKILDFGLAKLYEERGGTASGPQTAVGMVVGTPAYMAPEQAAGDRDAISPVTDIYAVGVILYQMLCGRTPFDSELAGKLLAMQIYDTAPPLRELEPSVPEDVARVVHRCLEKEPAARPPSARALMLEFAQALGAESMAQTLPPLSSEVALSAIPAAQAATVTSQPAIAAVVSQPTVLGEPTAADLTGPVRSFQPGPAPIQPGPPGDLTGPVHPSLPAPADLTGPARPVNNSLATGPTVAPTTPPPGTVPAPVIAPTPKPTTMSRAVGQVSPVATATTAVPRDRSTLWLGIGGGGALLAIAAAALYVVSSSGRGADLPGEPAAAPVAARPAAPPKAPDAPPKAPDVAAPKPLAGEAAKVLVVDGKGPGTCRLPGHRPQRLPCRFEVAAGNVQLRVERPGLAPVTKTLAVKVDLRLTVTAKGGRLVLGPAKSAPARVAGRKRVRPARVTAKPPKPPVARPKPTPAPAPPKVATPKPPAPPKKPSKPRRPRTKPERKVGEGTLAF